MFSLFISVLSICLVLVLCFTTVYYAMPDQLMNFVYGFLIWLTISTVSCFVFYKKMKNKYKKSILEKQSKVSLMDESQAIIFIVDGMLKGEIYSESITDLVKVLKVIERRKPEIEKEIAESYSNLITKRRDMTDHDIYNLIRSSNDKVST